MVPGRALVLSVDVITPVVNDPYAFGQVAAANALSDVYAMGAQPVLALNVVGYPVGGLPLAHLQEILRGGADKVAEAGAVLAGGHSLDDPCPKYGLVAAGLVSPDRLTTRAGARPGDSLVLTKPLADQAAGRGGDHHGGRPGTGGRGERGAGGGADGGPQRPGRGGHGGPGRQGVHGRERVRAARPPARDAPPERRGGTAAARPRAGAAGGVGPGGGGGLRGTRNNLRYLEPLVAWDEGIGERERLILCDAQTSGGLLMAVPPAVREPLLADLARAGAPAAEVGEVVDGPPGRIEVVA